MRNADATRCDEIGEALRNTDCAECDEIGEIVRNATRWREIQIVLNAECDEIGEILRNNDCVECGMQRDGRDPAEYGRAWRDYAKYRLS